MKKNHLIALGVFAVFALLILSFVPPRAQAPEQMPAPASETFVGTTVCADCPGIITQLTLTKDAPYSAEGTYELSMTYLESDAEPLVLSGLWTTERGTPADPDATVYALDPDMPEQTQRYLRVDSETVRMLDREGNELDTPTPGNLTLISVEG